MTNDITQTGAYKITKVLREAGPKGATALYISEKTGYTISYVRTILGEFQSIGRIDKKIYQATYTLR